MKKFLAFLLIASIALITMPHADAQIVSNITLSKTTLTNTDAATATIAVTSATQSIEVKVNKTSGTVAGTVKLQGSFDGTNWDDLNTLTLADQALNRKTMAIPTPLIYPKYRVQFSQTGGVTTITAQVLKRGS